MPALKKYRFIYTLLIGGLLAFSSQQDKKPPLSKVLPPEFCNTQNVTFKDGEEVTYKLYYQLNFIWLAAGEIVFRVEETPDTYKVTADGRTISAFEWFYKVEDHYETILDKKTMLPIEFTRDISEGKFQLYNRFVFDQENRKVISYKGKSRDNLKIEYYDLSHCMHDMMSILYYVRNMDFDAIGENETFPVSIFLENEYPLNVKMLSKNEIKRFKGLGKYKAHSISPEVLEGYYFNEGTEMKIWFTADSNKIPLMVESPVSVGSVKAVLKKWRGLRHPFDAVYFE